MSTNIARQRSKKACISCRERKRKCDGQLPCTYCVKNEHDCFYEHRRPRKKGIRQTRSQSQHETQMANIDNTPINENLESRNAELQLIEANSPAVFLRRLGLKMDPTGSPTFNYYAWNLGLPREITYLVQSPCITEILTLTQMHELTSVYFAEVTPVYDFLDREYVDNAIVKRWSDEHPYDPIDSLLCGVAALGCLFGKMSSIQETQLLQSARTALEYSNQLASPKVDHVVGWLLRVIYLRLTGSQHATWMASCNLMHMIEATKLHFESSNDSVLAQSVDHCLPEIRRRIYSVAQLFNTWVSLDCSKSQVELRGASTLKPETSWTKEQQELCRLSDLLNPNVPRAFDELEAGLSCLFCLDPAHPMLRLIQCNICLCIYRRVRALGRSTSDSSLNLILDLSAKGLKSVRELVKVMSPWFHIVNIPFQMVCIFLAIDNRQSLLQLEEALETLKTVANIYGTEAVKESYGIASMLVNLQRQRKSKELGLLDNVLEGHGKPSTMAPDISMGSQDAIDENILFPSGNIAGDYATWNDSLLDYFILNDLFHVPSA